MKNKRRIQNPLHSIIALVYDFDGTLSPNNMQEDTILDAYGLNHEKFWARSNELVVKHGYERTLAYLKLFAYEEPFKSKPLTPEVLKSLAGRIKYYPGVNSGYFEGIQKFIQSIPEVNEWGIQVEHYIISSGMKDILDGTSIRKYFKEVYACEYDYKDGRPVFPKLVINDTNKTQFLFRINKGKLKITESINQHTPEHERRIPFRNMIYVGDGLTDVPSMTLVHKAGGYAIAVYDPAKKVPDSVSDMVSEKRAEHFAPADFRGNSLLVKVVQRTLKKIIHEISYDASSRMSLDWVARECPRNASK
ncbi:MAG TPA: HAD family hydrolase [Candidatus Omnitrophota bacterium]|nr:hypothetical protein [Candidatus Omnitrophota bacterium]HRK61196.1 HAD family hydrolase [Candidatus Omnitrophota bacterium]